MTLYEVMIKANHCLIKGDVLTEKQKENITDMFLSSICTQSEAQRFYKGVRYPNNNVNGGRMYPEYFIPPYNDGKKYRTVMTQNPKTHILSANSYELEIIRLLCLFAPQNKQVTDMVSNTLGRLRTTCYGYHGCSQGECFDTSLIALRFLAAAAPYETKWIQGLIEFFHKHSHDKHRVWSVLWYFWLCLSELSFSIAEPEILRYKDDFLKQLNRSCVMNSDYDKETHPILICTVRNCLSRLPEYEYIKNRLPFVSEKDKRLHFDMEPASLAIRNL